MMQNMPMPGAMGQMPFGAQQNGGQMVMDGNQMQQMLHMLERQAQMMAQMSNNMQPNQQGFNNGRSFNDRVEKRGRFQNRRHDQQNKPAGDTEMGEDGQPKEEGAAALYKGFLPKVLRLGPGGGVLLVVYTNVIEWFRKMGAQSVA